MQASTILLLIGLYFGFLLLISFFTSRDDSNDTFFTGARKSPWYVVAFGMIGASLSGVTFLSVPGWVGGTQFGYMQTVLGYFVGYTVIALVLMPLYYRMNLTSIYEFLKHRFGYVSHKTGAFFFFVSRVLGASFRLFLVAIVLQNFVFDQWNIPFEVTVVFSIALIWIYTYRAGIKTIVWTDTLQTAFMLLAATITLFSIKNSLNMSFADLFLGEEVKEYTRIFFFDDWKSKGFFLKSFVGGAFIAICMTGLDQDMMQKNLSCRNLKEAQKNMFWFSSILIFVNLLFLFLGALLFVYANESGLAMPHVDGKPKTDLLFPAIALNEGMGLTLGIFFLLGLIAAAYSSADSALTSLTTSFCVDFLNIKTNHDPKRQKSIRKKVHVLLSLLLIVVIIVFNYVLERNVIDAVLTVATYTYGPLLGLYAFGIFTKWQVKDQLVPLVCILSVVAVTLIARIEPNDIGGYVLGLELLPLNGLLTFLGLVLIRTKKH